MNEYEKKAEQFLRKTNASITKELEETRIYFPEDKEARDVYVVNIITTMGSYEFAYGDSIHNTQKAIKSAPSDYDILSSLGVYDGTFSEFCEDFGYSTDSITARKTYNRVMDQSRGLKSIFTTEQLEKLGEIQ